MSKELTVQELIDKLSAVEDKTLPIYTEGCDCTGSNCDVAVYKDHILITRDED